MRNISFNSTQKKNVLFQQISSQSSSSYNMLRRNFKIKDKVYELKENVQQKPEQFKHSFDKSQDNG